MTQYHITQLNIARLTAPIDSPKLSDFIANLDRINSLAEEYPAPADLASCENRFRPDYSNRSQ